jgi:flagellar motor protein MotB
MKATPVPRWAISFADLVLLLLGCFVFLHAIEASHRRRAAQSPVFVPPAAPGAVIEASSAFENGDARLTARARAQVQQLAASFGSRPVLVTSRGVAESGSRLDRFELAAARSMAVARALRAGGVAEGAISVRFDEQVEQGHGQVIELSGR